MIRMDGKAAIAILINKVILEYIPEYGLELADEVYQRAYEVILRLGEQPRPVGSRKLTGREGLAHQGGELQSDLRD